MKVSESTAEDVLLLDVAIIGGGAAGILAALHLLQVASGRVRIGVVEPNSLLGEGAAYSTKSPGHLLNVHAGGMSAFADEPEHFVRYCSARGVHSADGDEGHLEHRFLARSLFGCYLRDTLAGQVAIDSIHVRDEAVDIVGGNPYSIHMASGRTVQAGAIVLATGNTLRALQCLQGDHGNAVISGWDYPALSSISPEEDVCVVGSGLSMADAVTSLADAGHRGRIVVLSRHGLLPLPHAASRQPAGEVDDLHALDLRQRVRVLRERAAAEVGDGNPWQWTMDRLRPHGASLWQSLDTAGQRRFLRHLRRYWDIHRHRIAPQVAARIEGLRRSGQLVVHAGWLERLIRPADENDDGKFQLLFRRRHEVEIRGRVSFDRLISCTGIETGLSRMSCRLFPAMAKRGLATAGPHGLGLATDDNGALRDADGIVQPDLVAIGTARIGQLWETTAVPELRQQAAALGQVLESASMPGSAFG